MQMSIRLNKEVSYRATKLFGRVLQVPKGKPSIFFQNTQRFQRIQKIPYDIEILSILNGRLVGTSYAAWFWIALRRIQRFVNQLFKQLQTTFWVSFAFKFDGFLINDIIQRMV